MSLHIVWFLLLASLLDCSCNPRYPISESCDLSSNPSLSRLLLFALVRLYFKLIFLPIASNVLLSFVKTLL
uniref:Secreted protein n=1 Tax=Anopheles darlingi TaxID=43151 RepID=A0A2M4DCC1_ANODA